LAVDVMLRQYIFHAKTDDADQKELFKLISSV